MNWWIDSDGNLCLVPYSRMDEAKLREWVRLGNETGEWKVQLKQREAEQLARVN